MMAEREPRCVQCVRVLGLREAVWCHRCGEHTCVACAHEADKPLRCEACGSDRGLSTAFGERRTRLQLDKETRQALGVSAVVAGMILVMHVGLDVSKLWLPPAHRDSWVYAHQGAIVAAALLVLVGVAAGATRLFGKKIALRHLALRYGVPTQTFGGVQGGLGVLLWWLLVTVDSLLWGAPLAALSSTLVLHAILAHEWAEEAASRRRAIAESRGLPTAVAAA